MSNNQDNLRFEDISQLRIQEYRNTDANQNYL